MSETREVIRVLVADDELKVRESYQAALLETPSESRPGGRPERRAHALAGPQAATRGGPFEVVFAGGAVEAVEAVRAAIKSGRPFAVAFLDLRMPPGPDGIWAAARIRKLDGRLDIVMAAPYSDLDPQEIAVQVPPAESLFYLRKPLHPQELRQLAGTLGRRRQAEDRARRLASLDEVTGLPNRDSFRERLGRALELARAQGRPVAVLWLDLDDFGRLADTLGQAAGDLILNEVAKLLAASLRADDALARVGGSAGDGELTRQGRDEFTILLPDLGRAADAQVVAERLLAALSRPLTLAGQEVSLTASLGIAVCPDHGPNPDTLLRNAKLAMRAAKRTGKNGWRHFTGAMHAEAQARLTMENELRRALERNELSLHYQPQVALPSKAVSGVEALVRWDSPVLGSVPPGDFIPVAEETGLIASLGEWVLRAACRQLKAWQKAGIAPPRVSVNVSVRQFAHGRFPALVRRVLEETGLEPGCLELEITESVLLSDGPAALGTMQELKALGVQLAIDDFGTGYFRLTSLKRFPIDRLKIDRSFVAGVTSDPQNRAITAAVIAMAERMNLTVTAEGVETDEQLAYLTGRHCAEVQGYLLSRPMPVAQVEEFLRGVQKPGEPETAAEVSPEPAEPQPEVPAGAPQQG